MRMTNTLKREMFEGITLGYRTPEWLNHEKARNDYWPHSMIRDHKDWCIDRPEYEPDWENMLSGRIDNWALFVEERGGTIDFVLFIKNWLTTEDILFYQIAFDSDGTHMLSYFNEDRDTRTKMKAGRWFQSHYDRDAKLTRQFSKEWRQMVMKCQDIYSHYSVEVVTQPENISHRYRTFHRTDLNSCCSYGTGQYATGGIHPCMVYGGDSGVTLAVVKDSDGNDFARTLIYNKKFIRIYPTGRSHEFSVAKGVLQHHEIATEQGSLKGAKLNYVPHADPDMGDFVVCPYLDGEASIVSLGTRDNGDDCLDVHTNDPACNSIDTQSGSMHERACFDSRTMYINGEHYDYYCDQCEEGFAQFSDYSVFPEHGGSYCSEECASESGFVLADINMREQGWYRGDDVHYCENSGNYYTDSGLTDAGLVIEQNGMVVDQDDCVLTQSQGWLLSVDCLFVNTPQEYQDTPDNLRPVWMLTDGSGEVGTGTLETFLTDTGQHRSLVEQNIGES